jgi:hypothetical protein
VCPVKVTTANGIGTDRLEAIHPPRKKAWRRDSGKKKNPEWKSRRWVAGLSHSWLNRCRRKFVHYEKLKDTYLALLHMAAAIIAYRKARIIYG